MRECCLSNLMVKGMEPARGSKSDSEEWEEVEKSLEELVNSRRLKVERLERELDAFRKHYAKLVESFSFPTFPTLPEGGDLVTEHLSNDKLTSDPSPHAAGKESKKRNSKRSQLRGKAKSADGGEIIRDEATVAGKAISKVEPITSELPPSSKPASVILKAIELIDLTDDNEIDILKDKIRRARPSKSKTSQYVTSQAHKDS